MLTQLQAGPALATLSVSETTETAPVERLSLGRLIQVGITLCLVPALLVVLAMGTIGMLLLASTRIFPSIVAWQACHPRDSGGLESFRA